MLVRIEFSPVSQIYDTVTDKHLMKALPETFVCLTPFSILRSATIIPLSLSSLTHCRSWQVSPVERRDGVACWCVCASPHCTSWVSLSALQGVCPACSPLAGQGVLESCRKVDSMVCRVRSARSATSSGVRPLVSILGRIRTTQVPERERDTVRGRDRNTIGAKLE